MTDLSSGQRKYLRSQAHHLDPVVLVGKQGITETLIHAVDESLQARELIKMRFNDFKREKKELTAQVAEQTHCQVAGILGHVAILYREHPEEEKRRIQLPSL